MKKLFDCNAHIGNWPFRKLHNNNAMGLLRMMDRSGITNAVVSSIDAIFYKNCQPGNVEVFRQIKKYRERLFPFAVINPYYAGWQEDLEECVGKYNIKGITIYPSIHGYSLKDDCADELMVKVKEYKIPVAISLRIVDPRQGHWLFQVPNINIEDLVCFTKKHSEVSFIIRDVETEIIDKKLIKINNCYFDISRINFCEKDILKKLITKSSVDRYLFGSQIPFKDPTPAILKLQLSNITKIERNKIEFRNLENQIKS